MRVPIEEFRGLDLEVHAFLAGVPLRDVSAIDLPGGGDGRSLSDVRALRSSSGAEAAPRLVRVLLALRRWLGKWFGWDRAVHERPEESYLQRLSDDQRDRSVEPPGTRDGPFRLLYSFPCEALSETRNATVHAFSCMALRPTSDGYRFYWAIYVKNVSRFTPVYMAVIEPFRRFAVYPAILRQLRAAWIDAYAAREGDGRDGAR